jgi:hypothetical protein
MRKFLVLLGVALSGLAATASPAMADDFRCTGAATGTFDNVVVPRNEACILTASTVTGNVKVQRNAYFEAATTSVGGNVEGSRAQTVFLHDLSIVDGSVTTQRTIQVFLFDSFVNGGVNVEGTTEVVDVCGMTVNGNLTVKKSGQDILLGDPLTEDCAGNTLRSNVQVEENDVNVELVIRGNSVGGNLQVFKNRGPADKFVDDNTGSGGALQCKENQPRFFSANNNGFASEEGQCS